MLMDKLQWTKIGGNWFALFGLANLLGFGAHLVMNKDQYYYHFSYTANPPRIFTPLKAMMGSNNFLNVALTAPILIGVNQYLLPKLGPLVMTKFFFLTLASTFIFWSAFNPTTGLNYRPLRNFFPKLDSNAEDGSYYMGAD